MYKTFHDHYDRECSTCCEHHKETAAHQNDKPTVDYHVLVYCLMVYSLLKAEETDRKLKTYSRTTNTQLNNSRV